MCNLHCHRGSVRSPEGEQPLSNNGSAWARTRWYRNINRLEELAIRIFNCVFRLPSGFSPACAFNQPFSLAFQLASDLRRLPLSGSAFQPQLPILHRLSDPSASLRVHLQLAPSTNRLTQPSRQPSTCVSSQFSGSAFVSTCDRRRLPNLQPCPPIVFQLAPSVDLPAQPSSQPI
jgi:hypothetical protein